MLVVLLVACEHNARYSKVHKFSLIESGSLKGFLREIFSLVPPHFDSERSVSFGAVGES